MELITGIIANWKEIATHALVVMATIGGVLKAVEALLQVIAPLTPFKWDDNLATMFGKWAALKIFNKK